MSLVSQVFSAAFQKFSKLEDENKKSVYENLYEKYMGVRVAPPQTEGYDFPKWSELEHGKSAIASGKLRIATYPHEPYFYHNIVEDDEGELIVDEENPFTGWEYDMSKFLREIILDAYPELNNELTFEWVLSELTEDDLPMNGSDNNDIRDSLVEMLEDDKAPCDIAFSGVLFRPETEGMDFSTPTSSFYVAGVYTGRAEWNDVPTGDLDAMLKYFANKSTKNKPLRVTHTSNGGQSTIANQVIDWIEYYGGHAIDIDLHIPTIIDSIAYQDMHLYIGDVIQIQSMCMGNEQGMVDLGLNLMGLSLSNPNGEDFTQSASETQVEDGMQIAPFSKVDGFYPIEVAKP